jgi:putative oxidoreductase
MAVQQYAPSTPIQTAPTRLVTIDQRVVGLLRQVSLPLLRITMGLVFIWFGALKAADATPVGDLVAATVPFLDRDWFVPFLGGVEILLGMGLLVAWPLRLVLLGLLGHLSGTFLVLVVQPDIAFQHGNPLLLTTVGEFIVKNLVLIAGGLVLASQLHGRRSRHRPATG